MAGNDAVSNNTRTWVEYFAGKPKPSKTTSKISTAPQEQGEPFDISAYRKKQLDDLIKYQGEADPQRRKVMDLMKPQAKPKVKNSNADTGMMSNNKSVFNNSVTANGKQSLSDDFEKASVKIGDFKQGSSPNAVLGGCQGETSKQLDHKIGDFR